MTLYTIRKIMEYVKGSSMTSDELNEFEAFLNNMQKFDIQDFDLQNLIAYKSLQPKHFALLGFHIVMTTTDDIVVKSDPKTIKFDSGDFFAEFLYREGILTEIELIPQIDQCPNYPDFQKQKYDFCKTILENAFQNPGITFQYVLGYGTLWNLENCTIGCLIITHGPNAGTDGNIHITFSNASKTP